MLYDGEVWQTIGRWAKERGMSVSTVRRSVTDGGRVAGELLHSDSAGGIEIRRAAGFRVLVRSARGQQWLYLRQSAGRGGGGDGP